MACRAAPWAAAPGSKLMGELFDEIQHVQRLCDPDEKCAATFELAANASNYAKTHDDPVEAIGLPGLPRQVVLVAPRKLKRRSINTQSGRNVLMHSIAHIEFNAINLALDAAYRFRNLPDRFYRDWINIAADEARHFQLVREYLRANECDYGHYPAHNGLWEMAVQTAHDVVARMALVPRVLEARGLDVTPAMIDRLARVGDQAAIEVLEVIYQDEISHVKHGSHWFFHVCRERNLEPGETFLRMVDTHLHGQLRGPFNLGARLQAGFSELEMAQLSRRD